MLINYLGIENDIQGTDIGLPIDLEETLVEVIKNKEREDDIKKGRTQSQNT